MFTPQKNLFKYKSYYRAHINPRIFKNINFPYLKNGNIGLKVLNYGFLLPKQLKSIYNILNKILKKKSTIYFFAFPKARLTTKKVGARMGKGKSKIISNWVFKVLSGFILCEIHTQYIKLAVKALKLVQYKLPLKSKIILTSYKMLC